jgi:lipoyl(octanoyl) transferase
MIQVHALADTAILGEGVDWQTSSGLTDYTSALADMEARATAIAANIASERIWLVEHPPLYTSGTSADGAELLDHRFPVYAAGRGGRYTYHGPGQRVGYVQLNLANRGRDVRCFVHALEGWVIAALADVGVKAYRAPGRIGIWTKHLDGQEAKIGAIGVRVRKWVTLHGFSVNISPDLSHFGGIIPCGLAQFPVTSIADLAGVASTHSCLNNNKAPAGMAIFDAALLTNAAKFLAQLSGGD